MINLIVGDKLTEVNLIPASEDNTKQLLMLTRLGSQSLERIYEEIIYQSKKELTLDILFKDFDNDLGHIYNLINSCYVDYSVKDFHTRMICLYHNFYTFYNDAYPFIKVKPRKIICENIKELVEYIRLSNKLGFGITPPAKEACDKYNNAKKNMQVLRLAKKISDLK